MRVLVLVLTLPLLLVGGASAQNLITNGSFESPDIAFGTFGVFTTSGDVPGWTDTTDLCGIEIQDNCCGTPNHGDQYVEIDSDCPSTLSQTVATQPGASYLLTLLYSPHPSGPQ